MFVSEAHNMDSKILIFEHSPFTQNKYFPFCLEGADDRHLVGFQISAVDMTGFTRHPLTGENPCVYHCVLSTKALAHYNDFHNYLFS